MYLQRERERGCLFYNKCDINKIRNAFVLCILVYFVIKNKNNGRNVHAKRKDKHVELSS